MSSLPSDPLSSLPSSPSSIALWIRQQRQAIHNSQVLQSYRDAVSKVREQFFVPIKGNYQELPSKITECKMEIISPYTYNQRFLTLSAISAVVAIQTLAMSKLNPFMRVLRATRNAGVVYLVGGIFIAPEIYNPFIRAE